MSPDSSSLSQALAASLAAARLDARDGAAVALAERYAALIDEAAEVAAALAAAPAPADGNDRQALDALRRRAAVPAVLADLGPKLLACLQQLGLTPESRPGGMDRQPPVGPAADALARLRAARAERVQGRP